MKNIKKFIAAGNKVKVVVMLRGREFQHSKLAYNLAERVRNDMVDTPHVVERIPLMEGKNIIMILGPVSS
jgi:translation initiation factor IF-3